MKKTYILAVLAVVLTLAGCAQQGQADITTGNQTDARTITTQATQPAVIPETGQVVVQTIPAPSLAGNLIGEPLEQEIAVYLPYDYEISGKDYPVLYFLPGFDDSMNFMMSFFSNAMDEGKINSMIVVVVDVRNKLGGSFAANSPVIGNWEDYTTGDVVSYVESNYRTIPNADGRALVGFSMGGSGAANIAFHTSGIYSHVYLISPGLFDETGLEDSPVHFGIIEKTIKDYSDMSAEEALDAYVERIGSGFSWPTNFRLAYGSTFAYDTSLKAPFIQLPAKDENGEYIHDEVWDRYESGYGNLAGKLDEFGHNLKSLKSLTIEYGVNDEFQWLPRGCEYFSGLLTERGIEHQLISFDGNHSSQFEQRLRDVVIPFFSEAFSENK